MANFLMLEYQKSSVGHCLLCYEFLYTELFHTHTF